MSALEYPLERRARRIAERALARREMLVTLVAPPGQRPARHTALTEREALTWWRKERHSEIGQKIVSGWPIERVARLDADLAAAIEADEMMAL